MELDWRQRRLIAFLSAVLGILVVAVLLVAGLRYYQHRQRLASAAENSPAIMLDRIAYDATLVDPALLRTLPGEQYRDGLAEVIKYGIIKDEALFDLIPYDESEEEDIIRRCVQIKQQVVENDLYDKGERQLLNYGHTMGHALERLSGYTLPHGQAVAIGMALMARASHAMGCCTADAMGRVINLIHLMGLPTETDQHPDAIYQAMLGDKKRAGDRLTLVTLHAIGDCRLTPVGVEEALRWVQAGCGA